MGITQAMVNNPNSVLPCRDRRAKLSTATLHVDTKPASPSRAAAPAIRHWLALAGGPKCTVECVGDFLIETVSNPNFLQLQYSQLVLLNFNGLSWPHITVATLKLGMFR